MIDHVSFEQTTFERPPLKFEAGTPDYVAAHGLAVALKYVSNVGLDNIARHEHELTQYALKKLHSIDKIKIYGHGGSGEHAGDAVISFNIGDIHHMDLGTLLDQLGIAVRTGHHCAQPLMDRLGVLGTVRASFALYNTYEDVDTLVAGIERVSKMF
jgi:cysteine desulfurase/selenocysteine lyase